MEKSGDFGRQDVTPSAPPSYNEAVGGNFAETSGYLYPSSTVVQPPVNSQLVASPYPVQDTAPLQSQRPLGMLPVGPKPLKTVCPSCQKHVATRTNTKNLLIKYLCCLLLCGTVVCIPCSCLPFCMCPPTRIEHFCPACNAYLGMYVK